MDRTSRNAITIAAIVLAVVVWIFLHDRRPHPLQKVARSTSSSLDADRGRPDSRSRHSSPHVAANPSPTLAPPSKSEVAQGPLWSGHIRSLATKDPIAGATIAVRQVDSQAGETARPIVLRSTTSDATGRYEIHGPTYRGFEGLQDLLVSADGYASQRGEPDFARVPQTRDFFLVPGAAIDGVVVDDADSPVSDATIAMLPLLDQVAAIQSPQLFTAYDHQTAEDGTFHIEGLAAGDRVALSAVAPGHVPAALENVAAGSTGVRLVLRRGGCRIFGQVRRPDGNPVEGMTVRAFSRSSRDAVRERRPPPGSMTRPDPQGNYALECLLPARYQVFVEHPAFASFQIATEVDLTAGGEVRKDFIVPILATLQGRVVDADSNVGVPGVRVSTVSVEVNPDRGQSKLTDAAGTFQFTNVPSLEGQEISIGVQAPSGYIVLWKDGSPMSAREDIPLPLPGQGDPLILRLRKAVVLHGVVMLADGHTPAAGAQVHLVTTADFSRTTPKFGPTDSSGKFEFCAPPGPRSLCIVAAHDTGTGRVDLTLPRDTATPITLVLGGFAEVEGTVSDPSGAPVRGIPVWSGLLGPTPDPMSTLLQDLGWDRFLTDESGHYRLTPLIPGSRHVATALPKDSPWRSPEAREVSLTAGQHLQGVDFQLLDGAAVEGVVIDEEGNGISDARVLATDESIRQEHQTFTDADGYYQLLGVPSTGVFRLSAAASGFKFEARGGLQLSDGPQNFMLARTPTVTLVVRWPDGNPVTSFTYALSFRRVGRTESPYSQTTVAAPDGRTTLTTWGAGNRSVDVTATDSTGNTARGSADFTCGMPNSPAEVVVELSGGTTVTGQVLLVPGDSPLAGVLLTCPDRGPTGPKAHTAPDGSFELSGLPHGRSDILAALPGFYPEVGTSVEVRSDGSAQPVLIRMQRGGTLLGRTLAPDGSGVPGVRISRTGFVVDGSQDLRADCSIVPPEEVVTDESGEFAFEGVPNGSNSLRWYAADGSDGFEYIPAVPLGDITTVEILVAMEVTVTGTVTLNGGRWEQRPSIVFQEVLESPGMLANSGSDGTYQVKLRPGTYSIRTHPGDYDAGQLIVPPSREPLRHDIALVTVKADVCLAADEAAPLPNSLLSLVRRPHEEGDDYSGVQGLEGRCERAIDLAPGEWMAALLERASSAVPFEETGHSEWTTIQVGDPAPELIIHRDAGTQPICELTLTLPPGRYQYTFAQLFGGRWPDPANPETSINGGRVCSAFRIPGGAISPDGERSPWPRVDDATGRVTFRAQVKGSGLETHVLGTFNAWEFGIASRMKVVE